MKSSCQLQNCNVNEFQSSFQKYMHAFPFRNCFCFLQSFPLSIDFSCRSFQALPDSGRVNPAFSLLVQVARAVLFLFGQRYCKVLSEMFQFQLKAQLSEEKKINRFSSFVLVLSLHAIKHRRMKAVTIYGMTFEITLDYTRRKKVLLLSPEGN